MGEGGGHFVWRGLRRVRRAVPGGRSDVLLRDLRGARRAPAPPGPGLLRPRARGSERADFV